jgi:hypothetical protein
MSMLLCVALNDDRDVIGLVALGISLHQHSIRKLNYSWELLTELFAIDRFSSHGLLISTLERYT